MNIDDPQRANAVGQAFADYLDLVDQAVAQVSDAHVRASISRAIDAAEQDRAAGLVPHGWRAPRDTSDTRGLGAPDEVRMRGERGGERSGLVLAADTGFPHRGGVGLGHNPGTGRIADRVVDSAGSLILPGGDLRTMNEGDREETQAVVTRWRELLSVSPVGVFGAEGSALVMGTAATLAQAMIADRDQHAAVDLIRIVYPHLQFLGRSHPAGFALRRARAEVLSELGWHHQARSRLRALAEDERRVFGSADPQTTLLLVWVLVGQGRLEEAERGFAVLEDRLIRSSGADVVTLRHVQCRRSWLRGRQGRVDESVRDYARVIASRTREMGQDHADTLDTRHSQGKVLVLAGQGDQALPFLQALADDRARTQGERHPDTLETLKYLHVAAVQTQPGDDRLVARAIRELVEIDRIQRERHGPGHPIRMDTVAWLRRLLQGEPIVGPQHVLIADEDSVRQSRDHAQVACPGTTPNDSEHPR